MLLSRSLQHLFAVTGAGLMYGTSANSMVGLGLGLQPGLGSAQHGSQELFVRLALGLAALLLQGMVVAVWQILRGQGSC